MRLLRGLTFLLAFSIEVHVHAELIQVPEGCLKAAEYCVFKSKEIKRPNQEVVNKDDAELSLDSNSTLVWQSENDFSLVKGTMLAKANQDVTIETPYGKLILKSGTQAILQKSEDRVTIQAIFGKVLIFPLGNKKSLYVLEGRENYLAQVDQSLKAQIGIPKPILVDSFLKTWAHLATESKEDFLNDVERFKEIHKNAVKELSILDEQIVLRSIASAKAEKKAQKERLERQKLLQKERQEMYYNHLLEQ